MRISILTLFPDMFDGVLNGSIMARAQTAGLVNFHIYDIRDFAINKHRQVDDYPFGGGAGMLMMPQPAFECIEHAQAQGSGGARVVYMSPKGKMLDNDSCQRLSKLDELIILCGHYEGIDQRIIDEKVDEEISIGDYVLTGGELPAMVLIDGLTRLIPGVLGSDESAGDESFTNGLLEYPQYTRPSEYRGLRVPDILLSGHHANIKQWQREQSIEITKRLRPDLWEQYSPKSGE